MQALREFLRRGPSEWELGLAHAHRNLEVVGENVLRPLVEELRAKDPSVILVEHLPSRDPVFPIPPSIMWAIHMDLQPTEDIEQAPNLPFLQRRKVGTWWESRAAGIAANPYKIGDVYFTDAGGNKWQELESNIEYVQHALRRGVKPSELSLFNQLEFALGLATPVGDYRYGKGYRSFDRMPRKYKYWNILA